MIVLARHGQTEWSLSGQHTSRTDIALTARGEEAARALGARLAGRAFALVLASPRARAFETARLAGFHPEIEPDLVEIDYGAYEGRTTPEIREQRPGWSLWTDGTPDGETLAAAAARADRVIERALAADGDVAVFAHGHILRILAARWIGLPPAGGGSFGLDTAALCELGFERENRVISRWNLT